MPKAVGIDLGTTNSCVAYVKSDNVVEVIENHYGNKITPSVVHFGPSFKEVGEEAQSKRATDPLNTVYQIKRCMGRAADDPAIIGNDYPFEIVASDNGGAAIRVNPEGREPKIYSPEEISAFILKYMAERAREKIGAGENEKIDVVITVPANFTNAQREATKDAGELAGLNVLRIVNEPTAAALAYGFGLTSNKKRVVLVYDLGGGTFDVSIVRTKSLGSEVLSTAGETALGGEDFDRRLFEHARAEFKHQGVTIAKGQEFGLYQSCEEAKRTLSSSERATIEFFKDGICHKCVVTRSMFEELCTDLFDQTIACMEDAIAQAGIDKKSIDDIVLVGGSSRIPKVQQMVRDFFDDRELMFNIPPDHAVACGAAILAESLSSGGNRERSSLRGAVRLADVLPFSLGTNVSYDLMGTILKRNTPYPTSTTQCYENGSDNQREMIFLILEGEHALWRENRMLGICKVPIPEKKVGENAVLATYAVDENGILSVHLVDMHTDQRASTKVKTSRLSDQERMAMIRNARVEEQNEKIERAKYEARTAFGDAISQVKRAVHKTQSIEKKKNMYMLIDSEEKWKDTLQNASNEDFITRASLIKTKLDEIMK